MLPCHSSTLMATTRPNERMMEDKMRERDQTKEHVRQFCSNDQTYAAISGPSELKITNAPLDCFNLAFTNKHDTLHPTEADGQKPTKTSCCFELKKELRAFFH